MRRILQQAALRHGIRLALPEDTAAGFHALTVRLIHTCMLTPSAFDLVTVAPAALQSYLAGLGLRPDTA